MARWKAKIIFRAEHGPVDVQHDIEEIEDLQSIVECGPDWNTIVRIEIVLVRNLMPELTIEAAAEL